MRIKWLAAACDTARIKISTAKTKVLHLSRNPDQCWLKVNVAALTSILGFACTSGGTQDEEPDTQKIKLVQ